jgi:hypothetical protein
MAGLQVRWTMITRQALRRVAAVTLTLALSAAALGGCGPSLLDTTDFPTTDGGFGIAEDGKIEDNTDNRAILSTVLAYRNAMVARDPAMLRQFVASRYYEDASTSDTQDDDYGNEKLEDIFSDLTTIIQEVRYNMKIFRIVREASVAHVDYEHISSFRLRIDGNDRWESIRDVNRLTLVQEGDQWKIAGGL